MKRFTLIFTLLVAIAASAMAQFDTSKQYRFKVVAGNDVTVGEYVTIGDSFGHAFGYVHTMALGEENGDQIFSLISSNGNWKVKSENGEYFSFNTGTGDGWNDWNLNKTEDESLALEVIFEPTGTANQYYIKRSDGSYFKVGTVNATANPTSSYKHVYADGGTDKRATFLVEEYTLPERTEYVHVDGNMTAGRAARYLSSFTITDNTNSLTVSDIQATGTSPVYVDKSSEKLETYAGATLKFSAFNWTGSWMHAYAYIDYNKDYYFTLENNNNGEGNGEIVSYNYFGTGGSSNNGANGTDINGVARNGAELVAADFNGSKAMPAFTLPANLEPGEYRMRIKIDWNNLDADNGSASIASDNGCQCDITIVVKAAPVNTAVKAELGTLIEQLGVYINNNAIGTFPGQYSSDEYSLDDVNGMYTNATNFYSSINDETPVESIQSYINTINAVLPTFSLNMPVDGQAYTIKAKYNDGSFRYIYDNGTKIQMTATKPTDLSGTFVFRKIDEEGNYALVNNDGQYMVFYADGKNGAGNTPNGLASSFELGDNDAVIKFIDATKCNVTNGTATPAVDFLCCFAMQAYMNGSGMHYMMAGDPDFHNGDASAFYYSGGNRSSVFMLEEATYANTPKLNSVGTSELLTSDLHGKSMGTFSAPFATVVPEGVTAYYATQGNGYITLNAIAATEAIPANTGVVLVGDAAGNATMRPAAGEAAASVEGNVLVGSAGAEASIAAGCYVLSAVGGVAGFYATTAGTIGMNKAYIANTSGTSLQSIEVRLPGATAIEEVESENGAEAVYDLQGRRINEITKPGIYVVNGNKVLVK